MTTCAVLLVLVSLAGRVRGGVLGHTDHPMIGVGHTQHLTGDSHGMREADMEEEEGVMAVL